MFHLDRSPEEGLDEDLEDNSPAERNICTLKHIVHHSLQNCCAPWPSSGSVDLSRTTSHQVHILFREA